MGEEASCLSNVTEKIHNHFPKKYFQTSVHFVLNVEFSLVISFQIGFRKKLKVNLLDYGNTE